MTKDIYINTNAAHGYSGAHYIIVDKDDSWDKLSKAFKKYTHTIKYTSHYVASNYIITVSAPSRPFAFKYQWPTQKVEKVEVYFWASHDISKEFPLILGFIYQNKTKWYYTYNHLTTNTPKAQFLSEDGKIDEKDLITRLLEEIGPRISREKKLVIRLDEKPAGDGGGGGEFQYPGSGHYQKKITVKKGSDVTDVSGLRDVQRYVKYEHTVNHSVDGFYVSHNRNSMYFETGTSIGYYSLGTVTAYFESSGSKNPVLFVLSFTAKVTYVYKYSDFVKYLQTHSTKPKNVTELETIGSGRGGGYSDSELKRTLPEESEKLEQLITFVKEYVTSKNENISTKTENIGKGEEEKKFKKVTMTPDTSENKGSPAGPWNVYNDFLIEHEGAKIPEELLDCITTSDSKNKYSSITVYYFLKGGRDYKGLLVEFDPGSGGNKKYIKREDPDGKKWECSDTDGIDTGNTGALAEKLTQIGIAAGVIEGSSVVGPAVGSVTAILGAGGGAGFAIYKYPQVFLSLIRR